MKEGTCDVCNDVFEFPRRPGRDPHYCSQECRRAAHAAEELRRLNRQRAEMKFLRARVVELEAAMAA